MGVGTLRGRGNHYSLRRPAPCTAGQHGSRGAATFRRGHAGRHRLWTVWAPGAWRLPDGDPSGSG